MLKTVTNSINASQIQTPITLPGDVTLSTGNLVIGTSGKGIDFSATSGTGTSELLSDYEEGTCTINGSLTTPGTSSTTYTVGQYVRIGRSVTVNCFLSFDKGTGSGTFTLTGLPLATANNSIRTPIVLRCDGIGAVLTVLQGDVGANSTVINLILANQSTANGSAVTDASMAATIYISCFLTYQV